ncbi:MAG: hypothetical protein J7496_01645 [Novosphingobium sp.]|nr:hypothetical protein [Novosphingobium sp.]
MRIEIERVEPAFGGFGFPGSGPYEKLVGRAFGALDPADPRNAVIADIDHAARDSAGLVAYDCDVCLLRPSDPARANGALFYDVLNRGNKVALHAFNDAPRDTVNPAAMSVNDPSTVADAGNGFLMRQGFSILWSGWQGAGTMGGDGLMAARLPVAPVTGTSREEWVFEHSQSPVIAPLSYPAVTRDQAACALTVRQRARDARVPLAQEAWRFVSDGAIEIARPAGFDASAIYEFVYPARDPIVMGIGFAAVRDLVSAVRHGGLEGLGPIDRALAFGMSQAGRFLRDFVYLGFNEDLAGRPVFDGIFPSMAGSRKTFVNYRFAQPGRFSRQHEDRLFPHDQFPFSYAVTSDPVSGRTDGIFARCAASGTCPKVIQTESSTDFFHGRASLLASDGAGRKIPIPDAVRLYHFAGVQHGGGGATANFARNFPFTRHALNPADVAEPHRALLVALDRWIAEGTPPPASRFPGADGSALASPNVADYGFPQIPGAPYPGLVNELAEIDYSVQPPRPIPGREYAVGVPPIDADGTETVGILVPEVAVPRGTYTGWAPRKAGYAEGELIALGAYLPFAATREERLAAGDPRPSLEERYHTADDYVARVAEAAEALRADGLLLAEDVERIVTAARRRVEA